MDEERIPGERDPGTALPSQPGIIGDTGYGDHVLPSADDTMDDTTRREHGREGGGDPGQRSKGKGQTGR
jgi:hypothetical protein